MGYPEIPIPYVEDSSVGYGQILVKTAITAINWYENRYKEENQRVDKYSFKNWKDRKYVWYKLKQDNTYNISMVTLVLIWGADDE